MADPIFFAPLRVPITDPRTGLMAREWFLFFQALWARSGGAAGPNYDDLLLQSGVESFSANELQAIVSAGLDGANQQAAISELREQVAALMAEIQGLKQGVVI